MFSFNRQSNMLVFDWIFQFISSTSFVYFQLERMEEEGWTGSHKPVLIRWLKMHNHTALGRYQFSADNIMNNSCQGKLS